MSKSPNFEGWVGIALGAWLLASPWVLGYSHQAVPTVNALVIGVILVLGEALDLVVYKKPHRHRARGRSREIELMGGDHDPEALFGLS